MKRIVAGTIATLCLTLGGCSLAASDPLDAVKQAASAGKSAEDAATFTPIGMSEWPDGMVVVYEIASDPPLPGVENTATGYAVVNKQDQVLIRTEIAASTIQAPAGVEFNASQDTNNSPVTMVYGKVSLDGVDTVEAVFDDGSTQSVKPIHDRYVIVQKGMVVPCVLNVYAKNGTILTTDDREPIPHAPGCNR